MLNTFKKYDEFINESLVILDMKGMMTNEFMNNIELKKTMKMLVGYFTKIHLQSSTTKEKMYLL